MGFYGKEYYCDNFPVEYILPYSVNQLKVYVNDTDYFMSNLPPLNITTNNKAEWNLKEPYFQSLVGAWIATYASGVSIEHLTFKPDVPKQITSFMRFHLYFTVRRIRHEFETMSENGIQYIMNKYKANFLKYHTPKWTWQEVSGYKNEHLGQDVVDMSKFTNIHGVGGVGSIRDLKNVYKKFIPKKSDGLTTQGTELLNQSIESYIYSVIGAQARTKQSIYGPRASALDTQKVFRQIVEDSIINYDTSTWINNMNQAITSTNVVLNIAISPTLWLIPSSLIILEKPIVGYNKLRVSDETMKFGLNKNVNYYGTTNNNPKKIHQDSVITAHLDSLETTNTASTASAVSPDRRLLSVATPSSNLQVVLVGSVIGGISLSKYLL